MEAALNEHETGIHILSTLEEHRGILREVFETAQKNITIFSPYMAIPALNADNIEKLVAKAVLERKVIITIYTDSNDALKRNILTTSSSTNPLFLNQVHWRVVDRLHAKLLIWDDNNFVCGSFNWLSALRNPTSIYSNYEISTYLKGKEAEKAIEHLQPDFKKLVEETLKRQTRDLIDIYKRILFHGQFPAEEDEDFGPYLDGGKHSKAASWVIRKIFDGGIDNRLNLGYSSDYFSQHEIKEKFMLKQLFHEMEELIKSSRSAKDLELHKNAVLGGIHEILWDERKDPGRFTKVIWELVAEGGNARQFLEPLVKFWIPNSNVGTILS
jgi:hypothetical protein